MQKKHKKKTILLVILLISYAFCLPKELFTKPTSTVITSKNGELLGALIAEDGQWRFPHNNVVPEKFKTCLIHFEDAHFYKHLGFNPISILKAIRKNFKAGKVVMGGSTITQQVIRLSRNHRQRTYFEKVKELVLATRLEIRFSKEKIIAYWSSNAPFGGNVVGLDAASWRYFKRKSNELSWAESATLAVLPNAPKLIYPGKNQHKLLAKRNRLLHKLLINQVIDSLTYKLAVLEKLPQKAFSIPQTTPHLLQKIAKEQKGKTVKTSIDKKLQQQINVIVKQHHQQLQLNNINNIAALVLNVKTKKVMAYVGNAPTTTEHQKDVDIITKPRSTGSILKPFLYAAMLDDGALLPKMLVSDVPTTFGDYRPTNFSNTYAGVIAADKALSKSLNVPAVKMLQSFGVEKFYDYLQKLEIRHINKTANHYGLTLALGGAEASLWDLCKSYASMAATINNYNETSSEYYFNQFAEPVFYQQENIDLKKKQHEKIVFDAASCYLTFESLLQVNRPDASKNWEYFNSTKKIAWKTGTSFGFRDAWAIGTTSNYVVGVWVGNADGEGRPGLVGVETAAPILFDVFDKLPNSTWFEKPYDAMTKVAICTKSGHRASVNCKEVTQNYIQNSGLETRPCPYHIYLNLDKSKTYQVNSSCEKTEDIQQVSWFVLPPLEEYYYKKNNLFYKTIPKFKEGCLGETDINLKFIYPTENSTVFLPKDFDGNKNHFVAKVAHSNSDATLYWYLDDVYLGITNQIHELEILENPGVYVLSVTDNSGNTIQEKITIKE